MYQEANMPKSIHKTGIKVTVDMQTKLVSSQKQMLAWAQLMRMLIAGVKASER
jgi:hypothetical protein